MGEDPQLRPTQASRIHDTGMHQAVDNDDIVFANQRADRAERCRVAAGKTQCCLSAFERGQLSFEFVVRSERTTNQSRCPGTHTEMPNTLGGSLFERRVSGESKIIV